MTVALCVVVAAVGILEVSVVVEVCLVVAVAVLAVVVASFLSLCSFSSPAMWNDSGTVLRVSSSHTAKDASATWIVFVSACLSVLVRGPPLCTLISKY